MMVIINYKYLREACILTRKELDYEKIGFRIKTLRQEKKILQTDFGKMLGISQTHMSNIENGNAGITLENLVKMSSIFDCTIDSIVFGNDVIEKEKTSGTGSLKDISVDDLLRALQLLKELK